MKLKDFLIIMEAECKDFINIKFDIDLGINNDMNINDKSKNRIRFSVIKKGPKKK